MHLCDALFFANFTDTDPARPNNPAPLLIYIVEDSSFIFYAFKQYQAMIIYNLEGIACS